MSVRASCPQCNHCKELTQEDAANKYEDERYSDPIVLAKTMASYAVQNFASKRRSSGDSGISKVQWPTSRFAPTCQNELCFFNIDGSPTMAQQLKENDGSHRPRWLRDMQNDETSQKRTSKSRSRSRTCLRSRPQRQGQYSNSTRLGLQDMTDNLGQLTNLELRKLIVKTCAEMHQREKDSVPRRS